MIRKLPFWVWIGGVLLTLSAGFVNAVALLSFSNQAVTHVTGTVTLAAAALAQQQWAAVWHFASVVLAFFLGAVISGLITKGSSLRLGRRYGFALFLESAFLLFSMILFEHSSIWGQLVASLACGLQNAMVSAFSSAIIRTTHMSGIVTDLGAKVGYWLRGSKMDKRRFTLYLLLLIGFTTGSISGASAFIMIGYQALLIPATITGLSGLLYTLHVVRIRKTSGNLLMS